MCNKYKQLKKRTILWTAFFIIVKLYFDST